MKKTAKEIFHEMDTTVSFELYRRFPKTKNTELLLKGLEWSCHGIPFFAFTTIALYLWPNSELIAQLLAGLILDITYIALLKAFVRRRRPNYAKQNDQIVIAMDKHSFPSGHASRAVFVALLFSGHSFFSILISVWAASVCISRILLGRHFVTDVAAGVFLGFFEHWFQFGIGQGLCNGLIWGITYLLGVQFTNTNDFDTERPMSFGDDD